MNITPLNASYDAYIRQGWSLVPIPPGTKGPRHTGWQHKGAMLKSGADLPDGYGVGLAHAYSGTMALDIDNWDIATQMLAEVGVDLAALYQAHDAVTIESGRAGRGKLLYAMPFGMVLPTRKVSKTVDNQVYLAYEMRCGTKANTTAQDVIPPTIHPLTGQPYRWGGRGDWSRLPTIPIELLDHWHEFVKADSRKLIKSATNQWVSWDDIREALHHIDPGCDRDTWVSVGMALHSVYVPVAGDHPGLILWDEWSQGSVLKYKGLADLEACWRSFKPDSGITIGTLFHHAKQAGWSRAVASAEHLFAHVEPTSPKLTGAYMEPPAPDVPMDIFPPSLVDRAMEISETRGCDPLVPIIAGLAAVCGAVDARTRLELMPEFEVPPILWLMTIGDPADKKTPGSAPMFDPIHAIEQADVKRYKSEMLVWEGMEARYASAKKEFLTQSANPLEALPNATMPTVPELPPQPVPLRIIVSDITSQKLVRQAADRPAGLLCYLDEMAGWVAKVCDVRSGDDRSAWVQGYEGKPYRMDRVTAGQIDCEHFAVSIYGNIQPRVFRENLPALSRDGLVQRFIPVVLRAEYTRRNEPREGWLSGKPQWESVIRAIHALPQRTYTLEPGAYAMYREFQTWYEELRQDERTIQGSDTYLTALGKLEGLTGRLALVFHILTDPHAPRVSEATMRCAIRAAREWVIPTYRYVYNLLTLGHTVDRWIMEYVVQHSGEVDTLTLAQIRASGRRVFDGKSLPQVEMEIRTAMDWLASQNWVTLVEDSRKSTVWAINPRLGDSFADYRRSVIKARQRIRDAIIDRHPQTQATRSVKFNDPRWWDVDFTGAGGEPASKPGQS